MTRKIFLMFALTTLLLPGLQAVQAETSYVADSIEVSLRTGPSNADKIIRMLQTDDPLDVLEEQKNWLFVRTREGDQGWVSKRYVSQDTPKTIQIQELTKRNEQLEALSGGAAGQLDGLQKEKNSLEEALANTERDYQQLKGKYTALESDAANVLTLKQKFAETEDMLKKAAADLERSNEEIKELRASANLKWFLSGAGVVCVTWLIGYLMGRSKSRQHSPRLS